MRRMRRWGIGIGVVAALLSLVPLSPLTFDRAWDIIYGGERGCDATLPVGERESCYVAVAYFEALARHDWEQAHRYPDADLGLTLTPERLRAEWQGRAIRGYRINGDSSDQRVGADSALIDGPITMRWWGSAYTSISLVKVEGTWKVARVYARF